MGTVFRIATMAEAQLVVVACVNGVFWSFIPQAPQTGMYKWNQALGLPSQNIRGFFGLTLGNILDSARRRRVIVSSWGTSAAPTSIFEGAFNSLGQLVFHPTTIDPWQIQLQMRATSLASSNTDPPEGLATIYAVSAGDDGLIKAVLKSLDGGFNWRLLSPALGNPPTFHNFVTTAGDQGNDYRPCNAIAVSPRDPNTVVIAWRHEALFYSNDGGSNWGMTNWSLHLHSDFHTVYFDPMDPTGQRIYTGGDGGLVLIPGLGASPEAFVSKFNRELLNLQFMSPTPRSRGFWGSFTASDAYGVAAGGLQDNGI
jgi:hypothetical protein